MTHRFLLRGRALGLPLALLATPLAAQTTTTTTTTTATPTAAAADSQGEVVKLPEFNVSGSAATDPYRISDVTSVARIAGSITNAPFTVNVVPPAMLSDLGANTGFDVDKYFAGVSAGRGAGIEGISDRQDFRGFESFTRTVDNFATTGFQANWDPAFIERQELVLGPDSILSPTGTPGGSVNVISKSPEFAPSTWVSAQVGNINAGKYTVDTTGSVSPDLAYRAILSYQDTPTYMPGHFKQMDEAFMLKDKVGKKGQLTVRYFHEDWEQRGEAANANDWGEMLYTPSTLNATISNTPQPGFGFKSWNGSATWSRRDDRVTLGEAEYTQPLGDVVNMRLAAQFQIDHWTQDAAYPSSNPGVTYNPATGIANGLASSATGFNPASAPIVGQYSTLYNREFQLQNDYAANLKPGAVSIQPVVGWAYEQLHTIYAYSGQDKSAADLPAVNLFANNGTQVVGAAQHPPLANYTSGDSNKPVFSLQKQVYALTRVGLYDDRVFLSAGASRVYLDAFNYSSAHTVPNGANFPGFTGPYTLQQLDSQQDTYMGGALLKPTTWSSLYYSFSTNAALTSFNSQPLWQQGKQYEFGVKSEFFDQRLSISVDHFQIVEDNLVTPNPAFNVDTTQPQNLLVDATSKGYELNVVGGLTKNLTVIGSVTAMKYRDNFGRRVRNVPDRLANLLLNYHLDSGALKGFNVFAGVVHEGKVAGETVTAASALGVPEQPSFYVAGWTVLNGGAGYAWGRYKINVDVDNLLDRRFFWDPAGRNSVPVYDGITFRTTLTARF